jgi:1-acyl-sn-glycerol-3-phosphate acyltransferase
VSGLTPDEHRHAPTMTSVASGIGEPFDVRWKRRAVSIPAMLAVAVASFVLSPFAAVALVVADLAVGRVRLPRLRLFGVALQYLFNDSVEILLAPLLWLRAGFGATVHLRASQRRHARLQRWSIDVLARRAERLLGIRVEVTGTDALRPAPAIVLSRHVSLADASLPVLLYGQEIGYDARGVIMAEMLADPGFDLLYGRLGSVFINRGRGEEAQRAIRRLGEGLDHRSVAVICPEGRLFRPDALERALDRLRHSDPERAERLSGLRHVLPPRPGGVISLLDGAPEADVVIISHAGFEAVPSLAVMARSAPLDRAITVEVRRVPRSQIPDDTEDRVRWLDDEWRRVDAWVQEQLAQR